MRRLDAVPAEYVVFVALISFLLGASDSTSDLVVVGLVATPGLLLGGIYLVGMLLESG